MAIKIVSLKKEHIPDVDPETQKAMLLGSSYGVMRGHRILAALGVIQLWPGRGWAWILNYDMRPREWLELSQRINDTLPSLGYRRVEAVITDKFDVGVRFAKRCGFEKEAFCRKIMPDGSDGWLYVRIENG